VYVLVVELALLQIEDEVKSGAYCHRLSLYFNTLWKYQGFGTSLEILTKWPPPQYIQTSEQMNGVGLSIIVTVKPGCSVRPWVLQHCNQSCNVDWQIAIETCKLPHKLQLSIAPIPITKNNKYKTKYEY
jgi:hypothetical protein